MEGLQTVTNKKTGEKGFIIDGKVTPVSQLQTATNKQTGEKGVIIKGQIVPTGPANNQVITDEGGSASERVRAGLKVTPQGRLEFVQSQVGEQNAMLLPNGKVAFRRAENEQFRPFDETGPSATDLLDLSGAAFEVAPGVAAAARFSPQGRGLNVLAKGAAAAAGADALGNVARQGVSATLPGSDGLSAVDRAANVGLAAAAGAVGQGVADGVISPLLERLNPKNALLAKPLQAAQDSPTAIKGKRLSEQTGIDLSLGEQTGNRTINMLESGTRQHFATADIVFKADQKKLKLAVQKLNQVTERLGKLSGQENAGHSIRNTYRQVRDTAIDVRRQQASLDFRAIDSAAGGQPSIPIDNYVATLDELIQAEQNLATSPVLNRLKGLRSKITQLSEEEVTEGGIQQVIQFGDSINASGSVVQKSLSTFGRASRGKGQAIADLETADQRRIAAKLFGALEADLDAAAKAFEGSGTNVAKALKSARDNYRANSQRIQEVADTALGQLLKSDNGSDLKAEEIAEKMVKMAVSDFRQTVKFLSDANPEAVGNVRRAFIEKMMSKSFVSGTGKTVDGSTFSMSKFNTQMLNPETAAKMRQLYTRKEFVEIKRVSKLMERLNDRALQGSQTAKLQQVFDFMKSLGGTALNITGTVTGAARAVGLRQIATTMNDPAARAAFIEVSQPGQVTLRSAQAAATLAGILVTDQLAVREASLEQQKFNNPEKFR